MHPDSIWYRYDRTQLGSLHRRHDAIVDGNPNHDVILAEDLALIFETDSTCVADSLFQEHLGKALRKQLKRPRGRPRVRTSSFVLDAFAGMIREDAEAIKIARKSGTSKRTKTDLGPTDAAAD